MWSGYILKHFPYTNHIYWSKTVTLQLLSNCFSRDLGQIVGLDWMASIPIGLHVGQSQLDSKLGWKVITNHAGSGFSLWIFVLQFPF